MAKYRIFVNGFWNGFMEKTDGMNVGFLETLFKTSGILSDFVFSNLRDANVLLESHFHGSYIHTKDWELAIFFSGENIQAHGYETRDYSVYDLVLAGHKDPNVSNLVELPLAIYYIYSNPDILDRLNRNRVTENQKDPDRKFACFIVSNGKSEVRNTMFSELSKYRFVDSWGHHANNMGLYIQAPYWSQGFIDLMRNYKFCICFENSENESYVTEKIVNAYLAGCIPIYWGAKNVTDIFSADTMIRLEHPSVENFIEVVEKVAEIDQIPVKYASYFRNPPIIADFSEKWSIPRIAERIDAVIRAKNKLQNRRVPRITMKLDFYTIAH
jgi:hypothetical protein